MVMVIVVVVLLVLLSCEAAGFSSSDVGGANCDRGQDGVPDDLTTNVTLDLLGFGTIRNSMPC